MLHHDYLTLLYPTEADLDAAREAGWEVACLKREAGVVYAAWLSRPANCCVVCAAKEKAGADA